MELIENNERNLQEETLEASRGNSSEQINLSNRDTCKNIFIQPKKCDTDIETESDANDSDMDSDQTCPICMDVWTISGQHRLCCLRCGHLFGHSCILKWLQHSCTHANRRCPQCNIKASVKDIRMLYAKKLQCIDNSELCKVKEELSIMTNNKIHIERELSKSTLRQKMLEQQLLCMQKRIIELESYKSKANINSISNTSHDINPKLHLEHTIDICNDGSCRVLDYNPWHRVLIVSQKSTNMLFNGYGIKKIDSDEFVPRQFIYLHSQAIRDLTFHPSHSSLLLSVGFDKWVKLVDIQNNMIIHSYQTEVPLWSCCWSGDNPNTFFVGGQSGLIWQFDTRQTSNAVEIIDSHDDRTPVVSMVTVPPNPDGGISRGGFMACRLNTCYAYDLINSTYVPKQIALEGPFIAVRYNKRNSHFLISSRPNFRQPYAKHIVCSVEKGVEETVICNVVHTFHGGKFQQLLSRPCYINTENDTLIAAHQESNSSIPFWSLSSGKEVYNLPVSDPIIDMCSFESDNNLFLATLSTRKLRLYSS